VVVPGSLEARYERVAGPADARAELYWARRRLSFTINEWLALPWWQRKVYIEGWNNEAAEQQEASAQQNSGSKVDAILYGSSGDVAAAGFGT